MPRWLANTLMLLLVIGTPPFLVLSNLYIFLTPQYLEYEYNKPDFPPATRYSDRERRHYAIESIEYERGNRTLEQFKALGVYDEREIKHMVDVRMLIEKVTAFHAVDGLLLAAALIALARSPASRALAARGLLTGGILTLALFGLIGLFAASLFNVFFVAFHRVFFEGDTWLFNYTDSLIQFYPERFWFDTAIALAGLTVVQALIVGVIGWGWGHRLARRNRALPDGQQAEGRAIKPEQRQAEE